MAMTNPNPIPRKTIRSAFALSFLKFSFCSTVNVLPSSPKLKSPFIPNPTQNLLYHWRKPTPNEAAGINKTKRQILGIFIIGKKTIIATTSIPEKMAPFLLVLISFGPMLHVPGMYSSLVFICFMLMRSSFVRAIEIFLSSYQINGINFFTCFL